MTFANNRFRGVIFFEYFLSLRNYFKPVNIIGYFIACTDKAEIGSIIISLGRKIMIIGILKEIKQEENRVAMTPGGVEVMGQNGHTVLVESTAGVNSGFEDADYKVQGARIAATPEEIYARCDMVMHVKEPLPPEYDLIRENQIMFTYLHLAAAEELTQMLVLKKSVNIAYETIQEDNGSLPLLTPMSEVAGRMALQQGAKYLEMEHGGHGVLLGGVPGVDPGTVLIIGGGIVGTNAAKVACGLGAKVYILDQSLDRLRYLSDIMPSNCFQLMSKPSTLRRLIPEASVIVGAVLIPGAKAPKLITREMLGAMQKGTVMVDVAIDQGGCFETSRPTTHSNPIYEVDGIVHYCVANMPGALPRTSTIALTNATLPYALEIADNGWKDAMRQNPEIRRGANVVKGKVTFKGVADAFGLPYTPIEDLL
jgi:alanine dehydrogenase